MNNLKLKDKRMINEMKLCLYSLSVNEAASRAMVGAFCSQLNPTATELADIKCALSEAVTNCIVHAYRNAGGVGKIYITVTLYEGGFVKMVVKDNGIGIEDVKVAMQPLYTTDRSGERSGMGFCVMESFTDKVRVTSRAGKGTTVTMIKQLTSEGLL